MVDGLKISSLGVRLMSHNRESNRECSSNSYLGLKDNLHPLAPGQLTWQWPFLSPQGQLPYPDNVKWTAA